MMSRFQILFRLLRTLIAWVGMIVLACVCAAKLPSPAAYGAWLGIAALLCAAGAALIRSQPVGKATLAGRLGYLVAHYGYRASQGALVGAALISWAVWCVAGWAAIWIVQGELSPLRAAMGVTWAANTFGLMYVWGIVLRNRPRVDAGERAPLHVPASLMKLSVALGGLTIVSAVLWLVVGTPGARLAALIMAAAPLTVIGGGYGLVMLVFMTAGRNVRWN